jgi:cytidylate kinase
MADVVAIDGTSATGKSTIGRLLADSLSWSFLDSGLLYRAATHLLISHRLESLDHLAELLPSVEIAIEDRRVVVDGVAVSASLSDREVSSRVAIVAANPRVRALLTDWLRARVGPSEQAVVVGRDIGTVVFPSAILKVFLTAEVAVRAQRRAGELGRSDTRAVATALIERDLRDYRRGVAPLVPAANAVLLNTSAMSPDDVVRSLLPRIRAACGRP